MTSQTFPPFLWTPVLPEKPRPVSQRSASSSGSIWRRRRRRASRGRAGRWRCPGAVGLRDVPVDRAGEDRPAGDLGDQGRRAGSRPAGRLPGSAPRSKRWLASVCMPSLRGRDAHRLAVEVGALDQDVAGRVRDLAVGPPMTPARPTGPLGVGDHQHVGIELALDAVQGGQALARPRPAHHEGRLPASLARS